MKKQYFSSYNLLNYVYLDLVTKYTVKNLFLIPYLKQIHFSQKIHDFNSQIKNEQFSLNFLYFSLFNTSQPTIEYSAVKRLKKINTLTDGKNWEVSILNKNLLHLIMLYKIITVEIFFLIKAENNEFLGQNRLLKKNEISYRLPYSIIPSYSAFFNIKDFNENNSTQVQTKHKLSLILRKNKLSNFLIYTEFETFFKTYFNFS